MKADELMVGQTSDDAVFIRFQYDNRANVNERLSPERAAWLAERLDAEATALGLKNDGNQDSDPVEDTGGGATVACEDCGREFESSRAKNIHRSRSSCGDGDKADGGSDEAILDHERIATAMDSVGIDESVPTGDFVAAVDDGDGAHDVAQEFDIARADAADLVKRLDLEDALESNDGLATERFERGEGGASA